MGGQADGERALAQRAGGCEQRDLADAKQGAVRLPAQVQDRVRDRSVLPVGDGQGSRSSRRGGSRAATPGCGSGSNPRCDALRRRADQDGGADRRRSVSAHVWALIVQDLVNASLLDDLDGSVQPTTGAGGADARNGATAASEGVRDDPWLPDPACGTHSPRRWPTSTGGRGGAGDLFSTEPLAFRTEALKPTNNRFATATHFPPRTWSGLTHTFLRRAQLEFS